MKKFLFLLIIFSLAAPAYCLPPKVKLQVPFLCQAPYGDWSQPWQDACEEDAIVMAAHFVSGKPLDRDTGEQEILDIIGYELKTYGKPPELTAQMCVDVMHKFKGARVMSARAIYRFAVEDMKAELAKGNILLAPCDGRQLHNWYYHQPGPPYHYLVFKGYDDATAEFITNDGGTKHGEDFRYKYSIAYNAIHDWNGSKATIQDGKKALIVIEK